MRRKQKWWVGWANGRNWHRAGWTDFQVSTPLQATFWILLALDGSPNQPTVVSSSSSWGRILNPNNSSFSYLSPYLIAKQNEANRLSATWVYRPNAYTQTRGKRVRANSKSQLFLHCTDQRKADRQMDATATVQKRQKLGFRFRLDFLTQSQLTAHYVLCEGAQDKMIFFSNIISQLIRTRL